MLRIQKSPPVRRAHWIGIDSLFQARAEALNAFQLLARKEGIIPALESSHALAYALNMADEAEEETVIVVNLSGRGDKDLGHVISILGDQVNG